MNKTFIVFVIFCINLSNILHGKQAHVNEAIRLLTKEVCFLHSSFNMDYFCIGGSFQNKINSFELYETLPNDLSLEEFKYFFPAILYNFISLLNEDERARPYYKNFPMTSENVDLRILTADYDTPSTISNPITAFIFNLGDKIVYCYRDQETGKLEPYHRESYKETLVKMREE